MLGREARECITTTQVVVINTESQRRPPFVLRLKKPLPVGPGYNDAFAKPHHRRLTAMRSSAAMRKPKQLSELERARTLGLVGAVKGGPRDVAERHSRYLRAKLRRGAPRTR